MYSKIIQTEVFLSLIKEYLLSNYVLPVIGSFL